MAATEPTLSLANGTVIPQLAFGLYKIPADDEGVKIILEAIKVCTCIVRDKNCTAIFLAEPTVNLWYSQTRQAGYRHFDTASYYGNEATLGRALKQSGIPREEFFVCSKVWNDAQKEGRAAVRKSAMQSISLLDFGGYIDLFLVHWPVPGCFVETYKELELLHKEGLLKNLGLSNFSPEEYEELMADANNITVPPVMNQFEVSPFMYRPELVSYFQKKGIIVSSSKALHRGGGFDDSVIQQLSGEYRNRTQGCLRIRPTPAQILIRWGVQKGLIVVTKTATASRMVENRDVLQFTLSDEEMTLLDGLTTAEDVEKRDQLELQRKSEL